MNSKIVQWKFELIDAEESIRIMDLNFDSMVYDEEEYGILTKRIKQLKNLIKKESRRVTRDAN